MLNNPLLSSLTKIGGPTEIIQLLDESPLTREIAMQYPPEFRASTLVSQIERLFVTMPIHIRMTQMINDMLSQYYFSINPNSPGHIASYYGNNTNKPTIAGLIEGIPGVGKTRFIARLLSQFPQIVTHENFPHFAGPYQQVVWFSISVKAKTPAGFYQELGNSWNALLKKNFPDLPQPISNYLLERGSGDKIFDQFLLSANNHNIGLIHFDEIQNVFGLEGRSAIKKTAKKEFSSNDTKMLGNILGLMNTGIPTLMTCTPDGTRGLEKKGSVLQRLGKNYLRMEHLNVDKPDCRRYVNKLFEYQYTNSILEIDDETYKNLVYLGGGVPRLITTIFIDAQKNALRKGKDAIDLSEMKMVFQEFSPGLKILIRALNNNDRNFLDSLTDY